MLLVHPVNEVMRFLPALIGVFLIGRSLDEGGWWHIATVAAPIALGLLRYATTTYRIGGGRIELRRGLLNRATVTARLDRVRTVDLTASPIHRLLRLAKVEIGTGSAGEAREGRLLLDSLSVPEARSLRAALLHGRDAVATVAPAGGPPPVGAAGPAPTAARTGTGGGADGDRELLRLDPRWMRYAPLTTAGLVVAAAVAGATSQFVGPLVHRWRALAALHSLAGRIPAWLLVVAGSVAVLLVISVLALVGYLLNYWNFRLSRDVAGRSFHVTRGLLTRREISVEASRVRGLEWHEPLGLRLVRAARLAVIVTGVRRRDSGVATVVPPAPAAVAERVGAALFGDAEALAAGLVRHGRRATARRYTRALAVAAVLAAGWAAVVLGRSWDAALLGVAAAPPAIAAALAADRARRLGHALTPRYLVMRAHSLRGRRDALLREGIIGWNLRQSFFQRRAGLATLTATTAAGKQGYHVHDIPMADAVTLADRAVPGLLTPFLRHAGGPAGGGGTIATS